jgi:hypothetical protein
MIEANSVKSFVESSEVAKRFFEHLAGRKKNYRVTTVERAMAITGYGRKEVVDLFKQMTEQGMGNFIVGRRTGVSRFDWSMPMVDVAKAAFGEFDLTEIEPLHSDELEELDVEETEEEAEVESSGLVKHSFSLRPRSAPVVFHLPEDLTGHEAQRLAKFMLTLPVEPLDQ